MGTDISNIDLSKGTVYFTKPDGTTEKIGDIADNANLVVDAIEEYDKYIDDALADILKFANEELTFTAYCKLSFKAEVLLFGFWNALRRRIRMIFRRR